MYNTFVEPRFEKNCKSEKNATYHCSRDLSWAAMRFRSPYSGWSLSMAERSEV